MKKNQKLKILMIHHGKGIGGAPKSMSYLARKLVKDGNQVEVLFLQDSSAVKLFENSGCKIHISKAPIYYFYHMSKWVRINQFYKAILQVFSILLHFFVIAPYFLIKINPSVVYVNTSVLPEWVIVSRLFRKRVIVHVRESISKGYFGLRRYFLRKIFSFFPNEIIFISDFNRKCLGIPSSARVSVIYNYELLITDEKKDRGKEYDFLYLGGESYIKGWDFIENLLLSDLKFKIAIGGSFSLATVEMLTKDSRVVFLGIIENVSIYISQSYFLLSPFKEPHFSRPVIEAYAYGSVPIASDLPGIEEQILNSESGFLFDPNSINNFLEKIEYSLSLKGGNEYKYILDKGAELFEKKFSIRNESLIIDKITNF